MRFRTLWLLLPGGLTLLALSTARPAEEPAAAVPPARLIERLGSSDFAEREAATRALDEIGPAVLPALREAAASDDPEVRRRAGELVRLLGRRAEAARLLAPKRVRLVCEDTPVVEAVADLTRQSGFGVVLEGYTGKAGARRVSLNTGTVSFWEAFDRFCREAGVSEPALLPDGQLWAGQAMNPYGAPSGPAYLFNSYNPYGPGNPYDANPGRLALVDGRPPRLPTCYADAVRIRSLPAHVPLPALWLGTEERVVLLDVTAEPGVSWEGVIGLRVTRAVDDQGRRLTQPVPFLGEATPTGGQAGAVVRVLEVAGSGLPQGAPDPRHVPVRLQAGPAPGKVLKELAGVLTAQVRTPQEELLRVDDVLDAAGRTVHGPHGGWLRVIEVNRDAGGVVRVHGEIAYPPAEEGPPGWMGVAGPRNQVVFFVRPVEAAEVPALELRDTRGQPFHRLEAARGSGPPDAGPHEFRLTFPPRPGQAGPAQLVYVGRRTVLVDVPFVLNDVPLR
jgi:hypothetical protein